LGGSGVERFASGFANLAVFGVGVTADNFAEFPDGGGFLAEFVGRM
jgi:hypothetical protein